MPTPTIPADATGSWDELYDELAVSEREAASAGDLSAALGGAPTVLSEAYVRRARPAGGSKHNAYPQLKLRIKSEQRSYDLWKGLLLGVGAFALITLAVLLIQLVTGPDISDLVTASGLLFESTAAIFINTQTKAAKSSLNAAIRAYEKAISGE